MTMNEIERLLTFTKEAVSPFHTVEAAGKLLELDFELKLPQNQALGEKLVQYMSREEGLGL